MGKPQHKVGDCYTSLTLTGSSASASPGRRPSRWRSDLSCWNSRGSRRSALGSRRHVMGYQNVKDYAEDKKDWVDAGLPTEGESRVAR